MSEMIIIAFCTK